MKEEEKIVHLYMVGQLPTDVTVFEVPVRVNGYGDLEIGSYWQADWFEHKEPEPLPSGAHEESVTLREWETSSGGRLYAGYAPDAKALIVGKLVD